MILLFLWYESIVLDIEVNAFACAHACLYHTHKSVTIYKNIFFFMTSMRLSLCNELRMKACVKA